MYNYNTGKLKAIAISWNGSIVQLSLTHFIYMIFDIYHVCVNDFISANWLNIIIYTQSVGDKPTILSWTDQHIDLSRHSIYRLNNQSEMDALAGSTYAKNSRFQIAKGQIDQLFMKWLSFGTTDKLVNMLIIDIHYDNDHIDEWDT